MKFFRNVSLVIVALFLAGCFSSPKYIRVPADECVVLLTDNDAVLSVGASCKVERAYTR